MDKLQNEEFEIIELSESEIENMETMKKLEEEIFKSLSVTSKLLTNSTKNEEISF